MSCEGQVFSQTLPDWIAATSLNPSADSGVGCRGARRRLGVESEVASFPRAARHCWRPRWKHRAHSRQSRAEDDNVMQAKYTRQHLSEGGPRRTAEHELPSYWRNWRIFEYKAIRSWAHSRALLLKALLAPPPALAGNCRHDRRHPHGVQGWVTTAPRQQPHTPRQLAVEESTAVSRRRGYGAKPHMEKAGVCCCRH